MQIKDKLFKAFKNDHAALGRGLHELREALAAGDADGAKKAAARIDREAGAHIAFEEADFYPALKPFLSGKEVADMYQEHADGFALINSILSADDAEQLGETRRQMLIKAVENMQTHVSECGELFGAMGGLSSAEHKRLLEELNRWRKKAPRWTDVAERSPAPGL